MSILTWIEDKKRLKLLNAPKYVGASTDSSKGLWTRCDKCGVILYIKHLKENQRVCFGCSYHLQMMSGERIESLLDRVPATSSLSSPSQELEKGVEPTESSPAFFTKDDPKGGSLKKSMPVPVPVPVPVPYGQGQGGGRGGGRLQVQSSALQGEPYRNGGAVTPSSRPSPRESMISTWRPLDETVSPCDPLGFHDQKAYRDRLRDAQERTGLQDAIQTGTGMIDGIPVALAVMDFSFMGGSMGSVVGEKITRLIEYATGEGVTLLIVSASGGARMQEGVFSLMQMAKISSALQIYQSCARLLYISILTSPTTGGVTASFAMLGDIIFAEPKALIAFAGRRVIEQTLREDLPDDFQTSEYMLHHGLVDLIVPRRFLRQALSESIRLYGGAPFKKRGSLSFGVQNPITFLTEEKVRRQWGRLTKPGTKDFYPLCSAGAQRMHHLSDLYRDVQGTKDKSLSSKKDALALSPLSYKASLCKRKASLPSRERDGLVEKSRLSSDLSTEMYREILSSFEAVLPLLVGEARGIREADLYTAESFSQDLAKSSVLSSFRKPSIRTATPSGIFWFYNGMVSPSHRHIIKLKIRVAPKERQNLPGKRYKNKLGFFFSKKFLQRSTPCPCPCPCPPGKGKGKAFATPTSFPGGQGHGIKAKACKAFRLLRKKPCTQGQDEENGTDVRKKACIYTLDGFRFSPRFSRSGWYCKEDSLFSVSSPYNLYGAKLYLASRGTTKDEQKTDVIAPTFAVVNGGDIYGKNASFKTREHFKRSSEKETTCPKLRFLYKALYKKEIRTLPALVHLIKRVHEQTLFAGGGRGGRSPRRSFVPTTALRSAYAKELTGMAFATLTQGALYERGFIPMYARLKQSFVRTAPLHFGFFSTKNSILLRKPGSFTASFLSPSFVKNGKGIGSTFDTKDYSASFCKHDGKKIRNISTLQNSSCLLLSCAYKSLICKKMRHLRTPFGERKEAKKDHNGLNRSAIGLKHMAFTPTDLGIRERNKAGEQVQSERLQSSANNCKAPRTNLLAYKAPLYSRSFALVRKELCTQGALYANRSTCEASLYARGFVEKALYDVCKSSTSQSSGVVNKVRNFVCYRAKREGAPHVPFAKRRAISLTLPKVIVLSRNESRAKDGQKTKSQKENTVSPTLLTTQENNISFLNQAIELAATESVEWRAFYIDSTLSENMGFFEDFLQQDFASWEKRRSVLFYKLLCRSEKTVRE